MPPPFRPLPSPDPRQAAAEAGGADSGAAASGAADVASAAAGAAGDGDGEPCLPGPEVKASALELLGPLGPADLEACLALDGLSLGGFWSPDQWRRELLEEPRPAVGLWRRGRLEAMACGWLVLDELHITLVAVDPRRRRQGLGRRVLEALLQRGRGLGAERATLEVASDNTAALALYRRCGFDTAGVRRRYYRDGSDALIQWGRLTGEVGMAGVEPDRSNGAAAAAQGRFPEVR